MPNQTRKNKSSRKSPSESATTFPEGSIGEGNDKQKWVVKKVGKSQRWVPYESAELFGYRALTVSYLAKFIGKPLKVYEREYTTLWPGKSKTKLDSFTFIPSGDAGYTKNKKLIEGWLKTQKPAIKDKTSFSIDGLPFSLQVDSINKTLVSSNIMNMETFIKI